MLIFSFAAGLFINISFLLGIEWLMSLIFNKAATISIALVGGICCLALGSTFLIVWYSWYPRHDWKLKIACFSSFLTGLVSFAVLCFDFNMFGVLTCCSCSLSFILFLLHLQFDRYLVSKYINGSSTSNGLNSHSFVPSSAGISLCQLQLLLLGSVTSWYISLSALLFFMFERQSIEYDRWIYFCVSYLTTIGSPDIILTSLPAQLFFPVFAVMGLLLFGMVLVVIRRAILEWITLRVSSRVYDILNVWAIDRDIGLELTTPEQIWRSINTPASSEEHAHMTMATVSTATTSPISIPMLAGEASRRSMFQQAQRPRFESLPLTPPVSSVERQMSIVDDNHGMTWQYPTTDSLSFFQNGSRKYHNSRRPPHISTIFQSEANNSDLAERVPFRRKRIRTLMRAPTVSSIAIHTPFHDYSESPLDHAETHDSSADPVTTLQLYNLLQSTLLWQFVIALIINLVCFAVFVSSVAYFEQWPLTQSLVFCFGAITTMGSPYVLATKGGRIIFLGAILIAMGLLIYLGSIIAELISNQWRIHVETVECDAGDPNLADDSKI